MFSPNPGSTPLLPGPPTYPAPLSPTHSITGPGQGKRPSLEFDREQMSHIITGSGQGKRPSLEFDREQMPLPQNQSLSPSVTLTFNGTTSHGGGTSADARDMETPPVHPKSQFPPATNGVGIEDNSGRGLQVVSPRSDSALSAAINDLIKRCIFVSTVTQDHHWSGTGKEFSVKVCTHICTNKHARTCTNMEGNSSCTGWGQGTCG